MRIAIVGGGCSGLLVAFHLLRKGFPDPITIIEPRAQLGRGLAYSTGFDGHLLNVAAEKMSGVESEPCHFLDWLKTRRFPGAAPGTFAPRRLYGEYLGGLLQEQLAAGGRQFRHIRAEVTAVEARGPSACLRLGDGSALGADKVVLALGNPPCGSHAGSVPAGLEDCWHVSPWTGGALTLRAPGERILILGAGQTAVDAVLALQSQKSGCSIHMLSRTGRLPRVHSLYSAPAPPLVIPSRHNLRLIVRDLRMWIRCARDRGVCWRAVIDALRPISNQVWRGLDVADRRRFLRHLRTWWEAHRSRMAPAVAERFEQYRAAGGVHVLAGRSLGYSRCARGIEAHIRLRAGGEQRLHVDRVIDCTGIHEYYHRRPRPLIADLLDKGLARANDLGIGFHADEDGALAGPASGLLYTLGPPRRGDLFETIAVPEIRVQAEALASHLAAG